MALRQIDLLEHRSPPGFYWLSGYVAQHVCPRKLSVPGLNSFVFPSFGNCMEILLSARSFKKTGSSKKDRTAKNNFFWLKKTGNCTFHKTDYM